MVFHLAKFHKILQKCKTCFNRLTAASFRGLKTFAGPLGQQSIFGWPFGPSTDLVRLLWPPIICWLLRPQLNELSPYIENGATDLMLKRLSSEIKISNNISLIWFKMNIQLIDILEIMFFNRLNAALFRGQQTFGGPLGQQPIFGWPSGLATDLVRSEAACILLQLPELAIFEK